MLNSGRKLHSKCKMGNADSKVVQYDPKADRCAPLLDSYLACVESKSKGMSDGDECTEETIKYKACRAEQKGGVAKDRKDLDKDGTIPNKK